MFRARDCCKTSSPTGLSCTIYRAGNLIESISISAKQHSKHRRTTTMKPRELCAPFSRILPMPPGYIRHPILTPPATTRSSISFKGDLFLRTMLPFEISFRSVRETNHVSDGSFRRKRPWYPPRHEHTTTIPGRRPDDPRQHARQRRAVARRVCWQCHHRAILSADPWPDHVPVPSFGPRMVCTGCTIGDRRTNGTSRSGSPGRYCQSASDRDPGSASKRAPPFLRFERLALAPSELVGVAETGRARVGV